MKIKLQYAPNSRYLPPAYAGVIYPALDPLDPISDRFWPRVYLSDFMQ